jgi:hypothetical protein
MSTEVRFTTDQGFIEQLQERFSPQPKATDVAREALTVLSWAVDEIAQGRLILSTDRKGGDVHRLVTPLLRRVRQKTGVAATNSGLAAAD